MKQKIFSIMYAGAAIFMAVMIITFPQEVLKASQRGLDVWANVVFPSLLPFFIVAELLIAFGVVHFIGVLCEPIMRPLFNVPGVGGFVWTMGMASGYPAGAKFTARLRQEKELSRTEAERLVSFTNASNPLFIIGAVSIGFFHDHKLGILLAITHYVSNFIVGLCMRFYKHKERHSDHPSSFSFSKAIRALHQARIKEKRTIGKVLGDSVKHSIQTLLLIGGFIITFSVITEILREVQIAQIISSGIAVFLNLFQLPSDMALPLFSGLFEITIGANEISQADNSILIQAIVVSVILAFNGFSVQAQVASILAETDIRFAPYFFARLLHGMFAGILAWILYRPIYQGSLSKDTVISVWAEPSISNIQSIYVLFEQSGFIMTLAALFIYLILLVKPKH
ncbi:sporulation integral membrane protein YlbJ [Gracilibacillus sp. S3-1-1]|uniref:Sporulation integral membrane protein YlbJ n=1 Tax=Gracilibacillus pellucidus TaxID=3095368 RepID=A0ACC6M1V7_9BACI|nr:sporulation integral membrane protein YlbJ [Gracilibacillus sp. S3-1-1]MDX8044913.1 sporulation integral membrane protein YlbJ [Gracilibacillus sp. S3-1-1]